MDGTKNINGDAIATEGIPLFTCTRKEEDQLLCSLHGVASVLSPVSKGINYPFLFAWRNLIVVGTKHLIGFGHRALIGLGGCQTELAKPQIRSLEHLLLASPFNKKMDVITIFDNSYAKSLNYHPGIW